MTTSKFILYTVILPSILGIVILCGIVFYFYKSPSPDLSFWERCKPKGHEILHAKLDSSGKMECIIEEHTTIILDCKLNSKTKCKF